jgi:hypothetical protein
MCVETGKKRATRKLTAAKFKKLGLSGFRALNTRHTREVPELAYCRRLPLAGLDSGRYLLASGATAATKHVWDQTSATSLW